MNMHTGTLSDANLKNWYILGFGSIGQALLPLLFMSFDIKPSQVFIITKDQQGTEITDKYGVDIQFIEITPENIREIIGNKLQQGDFLINVSVNVSSIDLIKLCQEKDALYLDTCTEPWDGVYTDTSLSPALRTNYAFREAVLALKQDKTPTAVITHGANPGLVSHFVKEALLNMAADNEISLDECPQKANDWAQLACSLGIKAIHIAERDSQVTSSAKNSHEFVNTWSVDGFISEGCQPAELGWGTHERSLPLDGNHHDFGPQCAIYLGKPGASVRVRTWVPSIGASHGYLITHAESISLSNYLSLKDCNETLYRPTVHYAYIPCSDAILSLHELATREWHPQENRRLISDDIIDGTDELGVLLMGNKKGAYWFGSQLTIQEARELVPHNNATSLQVVIGIVAAMKWAIKHPNLGVIEPEEIDHQFVMDIARPYLGNLAGYYTSWNPLAKREILFKEELDHTDPWQFQNMRVCQKN